MELSDKRDNVGAKRRQADWLNTAVESHEMTL